MYSTTAYLYQQKQQVLLIDTSGAYFDRRWQPVYTKNLKIHRGVDNVILFEFVNQDEKPVNITGSTITFRLISTNGDILLLSKDLEILNATYGRAKVTLLESELNSIDAQPVGWSLERNSATSSLYEPVFTDAYSGGRGKADIVDSVYPGFVPSQIMTIPSQNPQIDVNNPNRVHTSAVYVEGRDLVTFQMDFLTFTGNLKVQASKTQLGPWYDVGNQIEYSAQNVRSYINVEGYHDYLRFEINQYGQTANAQAVVSGGEIISLNLTATGNQWYGTTTPAVTIQGRGTGATAVATANSNVVTSVTLVNAGEGYLTTPQVAITNGSITSIAFR